MILDKVNTHKPKEDRWLKRHKNVHLNFTPTYSSWLNQVECWFSMLGRQALRGAIFTSPQQLRQAIDDFVAVYNQTAAPFEWKKAVVFPSAPEAFQLPTMRGESRQDGFHPTHGASALLRLHPSGIYRRPDLQVSMAGVGGIQQILPEAGAFYVMDRGYVDFERLYIFTLSAAFFVVRKQADQGFVARLDGAVPLRRLSHAVVLVSKAYGREELGTLDLWAGIDAMRSSARASDPNFIDLAHRIHSAIADVSDTKCLQW